jgi:hypothetical protein
MTNDPGQEKSAEGAPRIIPWGCIGLLLFVGIAAAVVSFLHQREKALEKVGAREGRLTLAEDDRKSLTRIDRRKKPELWYRVVLTNAPTGRSLPLVCEWISPDGKLAHPNRYKTKVIDNAEWPTHARFQLTADSPLGKWTVRLLLKGRELHSMTFEVHDGAR